jgi:nitrite reductase/ring-hydroxylating ferredoxin subunit/uncharacterized membrane protein
MRSTAHFRGHPIHPALIPFPIGCLIVGFLFELAGALTGATAWSATAGHLLIAGIAFGLLAAVPGLIDYLKAVPPRSSAKQRARQHGLLNATALVLFSAALAMRNDVTAGPIALVLEALGSGVLLYAGWLGGILVNRNMMGVDHRYAQAGKWKELTVEAGSGPIVAGREDDLKPGQMKLVHVDGRRIVVAKTEQGHVAFDDRCTHRGASLAGGVLIGTTVHCLWHGSQFDVESGAVRCGPANEGIRCYRVEVKSGEIHILRA